MLLRIQEFMKSNNPNFNYEKIDEVEGINLSLKAFPFSIRHWTPNKI